MGGMNRTPTPEERVWAVLSHLSALTLGMGIILPVIGWSDQRRKSNYSSFQCLQALGYQSLGYTIWILSTLLIAIVIMLVVLFTLGRLEDVTVELSSWITGSYVMVFLFIGLYVILPVIAAIACALGRNFRYPIMGSRLARYLGYDAPGDNEWLVEEHEDRWVAAMGHFSVIIVLWGMLAPFTARVLQGRRSLFLKFQTLQTLVFQGGALILYFGAVFLYVFSLFVLFVMFGWNDGPNFDSPLTIFGLVLFMVLLVIAFLAALLVPLLHIMGQWAGYRTLKGDDYRYPLVGKLVGRWIANGADGKK
jgi:uncharacterized Tic20 family protein